MAAKGIELVVGAKRDPHWGPVVLVGLGGIMVEALGDVRLLPADLTEEAVIEEIMQLKAAKLLGAFRGAPAVDVDAVAAAVAENRRPDAHRAGDQRDRCQSADRAPKGQGVIALDALIVC